jgi:Carboxypeptidase regulatory-like domain
MRALRILLVLSALILIPALAFAQASITGVVKDSSGAVLPGVTVEAASPALIERVRTAVTDGSGQYRIVDLRPGTYSVTFTLTGFSTVKREGVELTGTFTSTVNADLKVGSLEETITVTGESPIVDVQSVRRQTTVDGDVIAALPTSRSYGALFQLVPAVTGGSKDVQTLPGLVVFGGPGGRGTEGRLQVDGLGVGAPLSGGGVSGYIPDIGNAQEVTFTTSGGLGEAEVGGPTMNIVPKTGGNTLKGTLYAAGVSSGMVGSNYTNELRTAGLRTPGKLLKLWDVNGGIGGPIVKDRVWYFVNSREEGSWQSVPGMYRNQNAGDPTKFVYVPDLSRQAVTAGDWRTVSLRLTVQPTARNRFNLFWDEQRPCQGAAWPGTNDGCRQQPDKDWIIGGAPGSAGTFGLATATQSPEISSYAGRSHARQRAQQGTWASPLTNRMLLDAGFGTNYSHYGGQEMPGNPTRPIPKMVEQCAQPPANAVPGACAHGIQNLTFGSQDWTSNQGFVLTWRGSASYVTGAHNMKFGYQAAYHRVNQSYFSNDTHLIYTLNNGVPNRLTMDLKPFRTGQRTQWEAFYGQEQWTLGRLTMQGALRYDHAWSYFPDQQIGPVRFLPTPLIFPAQPGVKGYDDITPRGGVAYDVFGNGKTSLKVNVGKYLEAATNHNTYSLSNPAARIAGSPVLGAPPAVTRPWTDSNNNYVPDCDLLNPLAQNLTASGGDICGILSNTNFGKPVFTGSFDPELLEGWGVRPSDWQVGVSVQQQLMPRVSVEVGYFRRWLQNFTVVDNRAVTAADFDTFSVTAPVDPRLPDGGGYVVSGLYNVKEAKTGQTDSFTTWARNFGDQTSMYNGVLINVTARTKSLTLQGGVNSGKTVVDSCAMRSELPETAATNPYCLDDPGFITRVTGLAAYTVPKVDVLLSGTFRSDQGAPLAANWVVSSAEAAKSLGRPLSGGVPNVTVNLIEPGKMWSDRVNVFDLRVAKILRVGRTRTNVGVDVYNILNSSAVLAYNTSYNPVGNWLVPTTVVQSRFAKVSASVDF